MLLNHKRMWDIYTASKEAQCVNIVPKKAILNGWQWNDLLAMIIGFICGLFLMLMALGLLPLIITIFNWA